MKKNINYTTLDSKTFIVNSEIEKSLILDESDTKIWELIIDNKSKNDIINILSIKFPGFEKQIEEDVNEFFEILVKYEILGDTDNAETK